MCPYPSRLIAPTLLGVLLLVGCTSGAEPLGMSSERASVTLTEVSPANGAFGVDPAAPVVLRFSHPMMAGMQGLVLLHERDLAGRSVDGIGTWSADRTTLTFLAAVPLRDRTTYVLHIAPGMMDASGRRLDLASAMRLGEMMAGESMSAGGMMGGESVMPGAMMGGGSGMGQRPVGVAFTFTTR